MYQVITKNGQVIGTYKKKSTAKAVISRKINASIERYARGKPSTPRYSCCDFNIKKLGE